MRMFHFLAAGTAVAATVGLAAPAAAQYYPQQPYQAVPQPYPGQPGYGYGYGQPAYGYNQGYGNQSAVGAIINQLLGNRYNMTDRSAVSQCANAAMIRAQSQYRGNAYGQYGNPYGYGYQQGYAAPAMRVTAITNVERRNNGLRVSGLMSSGYAGQYGNPYGYQGPHHAQGDVSFRCNVDYRGAVTNVRIGRNNGYRG